MAVIRDPASDNASIICELCGLPQQKILITRMARSETHATPKKKGKLGQVGTVKKEPGD